jgi:hypothetical protein
MEFFNYKIHDPFFDWLLTKAKYEIAHVLCDKHGRYKDIPAHDLRKIEYFIHEFKENAEESFEDHKATIAHQVADRERESTYDNPDLIAFLDKVRNNPDNQALYELEKLCQKGNFALALRKVEEYCVLAQEEAQEWIFWRDNTRIEVYQIARAIYKQHFIKHYNHYGIKREYENHPAYQTFTRNLSVQEEPIPTINVLNKQFEQLIAIENYLETYASMLKKEVYDQRHVALQALYSEGDNKSVNTIQFSDIARQYLADKGIYPPRIMTLTGNALQRQMQREYQDIIERAAALYHSTHKEVYKDVLNLTMQLLQLGIDCTFEEAILPSQIISDACYTIIENRRAIAQGTLEAVNDIVEYAAEHPIETALTVFAPAEIAAYRTGCFALQTLRYTYKWLSQTDYRNFTPTKVFTKLERIYNDFAKIPIADKLRMGTALGLQIAIDGTIVPIFKSRAHAGLKKMLQELKSSWKSKFATVNTAQQKVSVRGEHLTHFNENQSNKFLSRSSVNSNVRNVLKVHNMHEFFELPFGKALIKKVKKLNGVQSYVIQENINEYGLKRGDKFYLDKLHKDHLEVFDSDGKCECEIAREQAPELQKNLSCFARVSCSSICFS